MPNKIPLESAIAELRKLDGQIRKYHEGKSGEPGFSEKLRKLTAEEWEMIQGAIQDHELPCRLTCGPYGFALGIYGHNAVPEIQLEIQPEILLVIEDSQFPFSSAAQGFSGQEETLRQLSPITHRKRNQELLAWYGFEPLNPAERYAY